MSAPKPRLTRIVAPFIATLAAGTLALAAPAAAQGGGGGGGNGGHGGGGGGTSTPPPQTGDPCTPLVGTVYPDGTVAGDFNLAGIVGGCAVIVFRDDFSVAVYEVRPLPGWTYQLDVRNQTSGGRVTIEYTETATGRRTSLMMEPGKTVVKQ